MNPRARSIWLCALFVFALFVAACGKSEPAGGRLLRLATTTSVQDSGLLAELLPVFERKTGYRVEVSAVGSGKAIGMLREGKVDVAITHAPDEEQAALGAGALGARTPFMHNEFVILGPAEASGVVAGAGSAVKALQAIAGSGKKFVSRGDDSGTHRRELALWKAAGVAAEGAFIVRSGAGMAATLTQASEEGAFSLSDRATFRAKQGDLKLVIVFQGDEALRNTYSVLEPKVDAGANGAGARALTEFVRSSEGRAVIGGFGVQKLGEPLFTPEP